MAKRTLQQQGVPVRDRLRGPQAMTPRRHVVQQRTPIQGQMGGTQTSTTTYEASRNQRANRSPREFTPTRMADKVVSVGLIEAEFFAAIVLLILLMFANTGAAYGDKIMSTMKRGFLVCITFMLLALTAAIGPNAARVAKGLGALIIVAILVTTPVDNAITLFDKFIKADWVGTTETGTATSADAGTSSGTVNNSSGVTSHIVSAAQTVLNTLKNLGGIL
jgi:hypothetical protein